MPERRRLGQLEAVALVVAVAAQEHRAALLGLALHAEHLLEEPQALGAFGRQQLDMPEVRAMSPRGDMILESIRSFRACALQSSSARRPTSSFGRLREEILSGAVTPSRASASRSAPSRATSASVTSPPPRGRRAARGRRPGRLPRRTRARGVSRMGRREVEELFAIRTELEALALRHAGVAVTTSRNSLSSDGPDEMRRAERAGDVEASRPASTASTTCAPTRRSPTRSSAR